MRERVKWLIVGAIVGVAATLPFVFHPGGDEDAKPTEQVIVDPHERYGNEPLEDWMTRSLRHYMANNDLLGNDRFIHSMWFRNGTVTVMMSDAKPDEYDKLVFDSIALSVWAWSNSENEFAAFVDRCKVYEEGILVLERRNPVD